MKRHFFDECGQLLLVDLELCRCNNLHEQFSQNSAEL